MFVRYITKLTKLNREQIRSKLAIVYAVIAWNGFAISLYMMVKQRDESQLPIGLSAAIKDTSLNHARVITLNGLSIVGDKTYNKEQLQEARHNYLNKKISDDDDNSNEF